MSDKDKQDTLSSGIFICGGQKCPVGGEHVWDGPMEEYRGPNGSYTVTATCSKCGISAIDYDMMNAP